MWPDDDLKVDVDLAVEGTIESFAQTFRDRWGLDADQPPSDIEWEEWYELLGLAAAAQSLVVAALNLYRPGTLSNRDINLPRQLIAAAETEEAHVKEILARLKESGTAEQDWYAIERFLREHLPAPDSFRHRFFRAAVQIELAYEARALPSLYDMTLRLEVLLEHLTRGNDQRTREGLGRVARCFLLNLVPELCVMARSVLESALEGRLPKEYMRQVRGLRANARVPLELWIDEASASELLDDDGRRAAEVLAKWGGQAAHGKSIKDVDPEVVLEHLHRTLQKLEK